MRIILEIVLSILFFAPFSCNAQAVDLNVKKAMKGNFRTMEFHEFVFLERELVDYCSDSVGWVSFRKELNDRTLKFSNMSSDRIRLYKLIFNTLYKRIDRLTFSDVKYSRSKEQLKIALSDFKVVDFELNDDFLLRLFDYSKQDLATSEDCDVSINNYIVFVYDPLIYVDFMSRHALENYEANRKTHFIPCTLERYSTSIIIRQKMQSGLLMYLKEIKGADLSKIINDVKAAQLENDDED